MVEGSKKSGQNSIDHVNAPAITSNMLLCFYCTVLSNEIVSCKKRREKQHMLNERASQGN